MLFLLLINFDYVFVWKSLFEFYFCAISNVSVAFSSIHIDLSVIGTTNFALLINHSSLNLPPVLLMHLPRTCQGLQTHHHPALLGILHFKAISSIPSVSICTNIDSKLVHKTLIRRKRWSKFFWTNSQGGMQGKQRQKLCRLVLGT